MAVTLVQAKGARATSGSVSVTLDAAPTNGNQLILVFGTNNTTAQTAPSGYSVLTAPTSGPTTQIATWIKQAGAGESATISYTPANGTQWDFIVLEVSGLGASPTVDKTAAANSSTTAVTTLSTGPTATLTGTGDFVLGIESTNTAVGTITNTSGYSPAGNFTNQRAFVEYKIDTDQSAKTSAPSWVSTGRAVGQVITITPTATATSNSAFLAFM